MSPQPETILLDIAPPADPAPMLGPTFKPATWFWRGESGAVSVEWITLSGLMIAFVSTVIGLLSAAIAAKDIPL